MVRYLKNKFNLASRYTHGDTANQIYIYTFLAMKKQTGLLILLKTMDTINNCQRPVFSLGASQHMHKKKNL